MAQAGNLRFMSRFPDEIHNYYGNSKINRFSFMRTDNEFLGKYLRHATTRFVPFENLRPLADARTGQLQTVPYSAVRNCIGMDQYSVGEAEWIQSHVNDPRDDTVLIFLGCDESVPAPVGESDWRGAAWWAVDLTVTRHATHRAAKEQTIEALTSDTGFAFREARLGASFGKGDGKMAFESKTKSPDGIVAFARSLLDWHSRNKFCPACGQGTISVWAGTKRICPPTPEVKHNAELRPSERPKCITSSGVHNFQYPRTDPTVIMGIVSADGSSMLLGRNKRYPGNMYSCLAGFLEPGESIEDAVRRETWEESGVCVDRVVYHSSQPWPFPASLMIGMIGIAKPDATINLNNDPELADARFFTRQEIMALITRQDAPDFELETARKDPHGPMVLPPRDAIARQIIETFVYDRWSAQL